MMQIYDDPTFYKAYSEMDRSRFGLSASGEWYMLEKLFPKLKGAAVLDLGCGYGWHSKRSAFPKLIPILWRTDGRLLQDRAEAYC